MAADPDRENHKRANDADPTNLSGFGAHRQLEWIPPSSGSGSAAAEARLGLEIWQKRNFLLTLSRSGCCSRKKILQIQLSPCLPWYWRQTFRRKKHTVRDPDPQNALNPAVGMSLKTFLETSNRKNRRFGIRNPYNMSKSGCRHGAYLKPAGDVQKEKNIRFGIRI